MAFALTMLSACSAPDASTSFHPVPVSAATDHRLTLASLADAKTRCFSETNASHPDVAKYYEDTVLNGRENGRFDKRYTKEFPLLIDGYQGCWTTYLDQSVGLNNPDYIELARAYIVAETQRSRDLALGRVSFVQYRQAKADALTKFNGDVEAAKAIQVAAARQRTEEETARAAAAADQQATDGAAEQEASNAQTTAMMGMMMGVMSQPAFVPRGRAPTYVAPSVPVASAISPPASQTPALKPISTYRDATYCVALGQPYNGNMILPVTNRCNGPITVHFGTGLGGDFLNLRAEQERGFTTFERRVAYACFRKSDQDDYCFKNSSD